MHSLLDRWLIANRVERCTERVAIARKDHPLVRGWNLKGALPVRRWVEPPDHAGRTGASAGNPATSPMKTCMYTCIRVYVFV